MQLDLTPEENISKKLKRLEYSIEYKLVVNKKKKKNCYYFVLFYLFIFSDAR